MSIITIERKVLEKNDEIARGNRALLERHGVFAINLLGAPGAGKTCLLERTLQHLAGKLRCQVVEGDVQTDLDARRIAPYGVPVVQIVTAGACHLEAGLVRDALAELQLAACDLLVIENVGNLVCPVAFDLGEAVKIVVLSTTEGDDKPLKYPAAFRHAGALVINKIDLLPHTNCDVTALRRHALGINPQLRTFEVSCTTGAGIDAWCAWLQGEVAGARAVSAGASRPRGAT
jgi:hydrogenase nickel incorporation protein HypB